MTEVADTPETGERLNDPVNRQPAGLLQALRDRFAPDAGYSPVYPGRFSRAKKKRDAANFVVETVDAILLQERASGWQDISTAPRDGRLAIVYRPLASNSGDQPVAVKRLVQGNHHCWDCTVPEGAKPFNPTDDGACHVTHWMPLPLPPEGSGQ